MLIDFSLMDYLLRFNNRIKEVVYFLFINRPLSKAEIKFSFYLIKKEKLFSFFILYKKILLKLERKNVITMQCLKSNLK